MPERRSSLGGPLVVGVLGMLLAACGGRSITAAGHRPTASSKRTTSGAHNSPTQTTGSTTGSTATGSTTPGSTTTTPSASSEGAFADRVNLVSSDLPAGWVALRLSGNESGSSNTEASPAQTLEACATSSGAGQILRQFQSSVFLSTSASTTPGTEVELLSIVEFADPPSSAPQLAAEIATPTGQNCLARTLTEIGGRTGGSVKISALSVSASRNPVLGMTVTDVNLSYTESISGNSISESVPIHEQLAIFAKAGAIIELAGINLPASDGGVFRQLLTGLIQRA